LGTTDIPWDIFPDDERFLMLKPISGDNQKPKINIVFNWFEEPKERVPVK
jgi:hypothetical protein